MNLATFDTRPTPMTARSSVTPAAISDARLELLMARGEQSRHFRDLHIATFTAVEVKAPKRKHHAVKATPVRASQIRPCPTCAHPTRPSNTTATDHPGSRVRTRGDVCTTCAWEAKRTPDMKRRALPPLDVDLIVDLYSVGLGGPQIARELGVDEGRVSRAILAAGVVKRSRRDAALAVFGSAA